MEADGLPPLRDVIATHDLSARKGLGQHFLLDLNLTRRIARAAGDLSARDVVEVGPGPGGLTRALLMEGARRIVAVERDPRCLDALAEITTAYLGRLEIVAGDALAVDVASLVAPGAAIVANLPYNISTVLLLKWLTSDAWPSWYASMTLMFQREVAMRIVAPPGGKAYGRLSVIAQWRCDAKLLFDVGARAFTPPPKVTSSIVQLVPRRLENAPSPGAMERVTAAAFGQRRKMLRTSLKGVFADPEAACARAGIDAQRRAETLTVGDFEALARQVA